MNSKSMIYSDRALSQKLERTEAQTNADFVEARALMFPMSGAEWIEVAGAYAMFDTAESPLTQTFGLGLFEEATHDDLEKIETFFKERNATVLHEVSPMANLSILALLNERGCTIAMMGAMPGSQSQRNAEKNNFRVAYTRTKWQLKD